MDDALRALISTALGEAVAAWSLLTRELTTSERLQQRLFNLGWNLDAFANAEIDALDATVDAALQAFEAVEALAGHAATVDPVVAAARDAFANAMAQLRDLDLVASGTGIATVHPDVPKALVDDLVEWLLLAYLRQSWPSLFQLAIALRLVELRETALLYARGGSQAAAADDPIVRFPIERPSWRIDQLRELVAGPLAILERLARDTQGTGAARTPQQFLDTLAAALERELRGFIDQVQQDLAERAYLQVDPLGIELTPPLLSLADAGPIDLPVPLPAGIVDRLTLAVVHDGRVRLEWPGLLPVTPAGDTTLFNVGGFSLMLAGAGATNAIVLRMDGGAPVFEVRGRLAFRVPADVLAGVGGGQVEAEGGATVTYSAAAGVAIALQSFVLEGTSVMLGGAGGLLIEEARLEIGPVTFPLPPLSAARPLPFDVKVSGRLSMGSQLSVAAEASYSDGRWAIQTTGKVELDNGIVLHPVGGAPVLEAEAQTAGGPFHFAAAGAIEFPQDGAGGSGNIALTGSLDLQIVNNLPALQAFAMSASVANWRLSSDITFRTLGIGLSHAGDRIVAKLAADFTFADGFEIGILDQVPPDLVTPTTPEPSLVIERQGARADITVSGAIRVRVPVAMMTGDAGDAPVEAVAAGTFHCSTDSAIPPSFSNLALKLGAERLHLGGHGGLIIEDAAIAGTDLERLLAPGPAAPYPTLTFSGTLLCPVTAPEGQVSLTLEGAQFTFKQPNALPEFAFADDGAIGFEAADVAGLPLQITEGKIRLRNGGSLPGVLEAQNLILSMGARIEFPVSSGSIIGQIDRVTVQIVDGRPHLSLEGMSAGVDEFNIGIMEVTGAMGFHNLQDPLNIQLEGTLGGSMYGAGVKALVAMRLENGLPTPLGVCLDVSAGPSGIPIVYGFVVVGAAGGISFANTNGDPCDFETYSRPRRPRRSLSSGRRGAGDGPRAYPGCPCECPPPALNILCQPHPDQDTFPDRVILKFASLEESQWAGLPLPGGTTLGARVRELDEEIATVVARRTSRIDARAEAGRIADTVTDGAVSLMAALIPALDPANVRPLPPPELRAAFDQLAGIMREPAAYWVATTKVALTDAIEAGIVHAIAASEPPSIYDAVAHVLHRGVSCPDRTLQVTGTFSYTGVSYFLSVTGGVNVSTAGSVGVIGYLNVLSVPLGQLRAFVTVTSDQGDPEPSMCGDLSFEFGPLYLGQISFEYRVPGCVTNVAGTVARLGVALGEPLLARTLARIERDRHSFFSRPGVDRARPSTALAALEPAEASQLVAQLLADAPTLTPDDAGRVARLLGGMAGELWDGFNPSIKLCGRIAPTLFGFPLGGNLVDASGEITKDSFWFSFAFSPLYLLGRTNPISDLFSGMDSAQMGVAMELPRVEQLLADGLSGQFASQAMFEQYLDNGLARLLESAALTFSYTLFPFGMKLLDAQGRVVMPYLTPHPSSADSTWQNPDPVGAPGPGPRSPSRREVLFAALDRELLANAGWNGAVVDAIPDLPAGMRELRLQRDFFPHGGVIGAGKIQVPRLLYDAPPVDMLTAITTHPNWVERIKALITFVEQWVMRTENAGTLAFHVPAPNPPPGPLRDAPSANLRRSIDSIVNIDLSRIMQNDRLMADDLYALELAFFEGRLKGRLLGLDIGEADVYFVPPSGPGSATEMHVQVSSSNDTRLRQWLPAASLTFVVSHALDDLRLQPAERVAIAETFAALAARAEQWRGSTLTVAPAAATTLIAEATAALGRKLPRVYAHAEVSLAVPPELAAVIGIAAGTSAQFFGYSPYYDPAANPATPAGAARRDGGFWMRADLLFKLGGIWQVTAQAELSLTLPTSGAARLRGHVSLASVSGLRFLAVPLPLGGASLEFDSSPQGAAPNLELKGTLPELPFGQLRLRPLTGTALALSLSVRTAAPDVTLAFTGARILTPAIAADTPIEIRPLGTKPEIRFGSAGGSARIVAANGLKLIGPAGQVILQVAGALEGGFEVDANGVAAISIQIPASLRVRLWPGDPVLAREFAPNTAIQAVVRSDGTFDVRLAMPPLSLSDGFFTVHGATSLTSPVEVRVTNQRLSLAAAAALTVRIPGAPAQTAQLSVFVMGADGTFDASGQAASLELPGILRAGGAQFKLSKEAGDFRMAMSGADVTCPALPAFHFTWSIDLTRRYLRATVGGGAARAINAGGRLSVSAGTWSAYTEQFQSLELKAQNPVVRVFGQALPSIAEARFRLSAAEGAALELTTAATLPLVPNVVEVAVTKITASLSAQAASVGLTGTFRALRRLDMNSGWIVDTPLTLQFASDEFAEKALQANRTLFDKGGLVVTAGLGLGADAAGLYIGASALRVSYLGVEIVNTSAKIAASGRLHVAWTSTTTIPVGPFAMQPPSGSLTATWADKRVVLALSAGTLRPNASGWPSSGRCSLPALTCNWQIGAGGTAVADATFDADNVGWVNVAPLGVRYSISAPKVHARISLGAANASSAVSSIRLKGGFTVETLLQQGGSPWARITPALDVAIEHSGQIRIPIDPAAPATAAVNAIRDACKELARQRIKVDDMPSAPSGTFIPQWIIDRYNDAVATVNRQKRDLENALNDCGSLAPPAGSSIPRGTIEATAANLLRLRG